MKCLSCGAENKASVKFCEYCGGDIKSQLEQRNVVSNNNKTTSSSDFSDFIPNADHPIFHVWNKSFPRNPFNWLAFLFPIAFLAGYGAKKAAVGASVQVIALALFADIIFSVIGYSFYSIGLTPFIIALVPIIILAYKVSIYSDHLIGSKGDFNMGVAIIAQIIYSLVYNWITR